MLTAIVGTLASERRVSPKTSSRNISKGTVSYLSPSILDIFPTIFHKPLESSGMNIFFPFSVYRPNRDSGSPSLSIFPFSTISVVFLNLPFSTISVTSQSSPSSFFRPRLSIGAVSPRAMSAPVLVPATRSKYEYKGRERPLSFSSSLIFFRI